MTSSNWTRITTKAEYLERCADRYFGEEGGQSIALANGQIHGYFGGMRLRGRWEWDGDFFSRTSMIGDMDLGHDNIVIEVSDSQMRLTMNEGQGDVVVYDAKPAPDADTAQVGETIVCSAFNIKPEGVDAFIEAMTDNQRHVRAEPGNIEMRLFQELQTPTRFYVFGRSKAGSGDAHESDVADRGIEAKVAPLLAEPPVVRSLTTTKHGAEFGPRDRQTTAEELIVIAIFACEQDGASELLEQYNVQVPLVRQQVGSILFNVFTVDENQDEVLVYERWASNDVGVDFQAAPESVKTGDVLARSVVGDLPSHIHPVREIDPYFSE